ncbi:RHS repeat-associated core domain-containing protein, partial [Ralstonia pseudosolanacearum]
RITAYSHTDTSGSTATAANQTFGYDDQDRLTSYLPANSSQSYRYDANGNRTGQTIGGNGYTQTVDPASNRQTASTGPSATRNSYDAAGNLTSDGTTTYSYSDRGRLASVTKNGTITSYLYNGLGQRVVKSGSNVPTGATRYVYDEAGHLLGEYDQSGNALQETVYLGDTPIATVKNGTAYYVYADQIDTPRVITDTNNLMVWRWDQADPFGVALPDENPTSLGAFKYNLRFPGQVYDAETGKHYNANRDYDPAGGRYVQSDPIGLSGGQWSTYAYVNGNPISYLDPFGLSALGTAGGWVGGWGGRIVGGIAGEVIDPVGGGVPGAIIGGRVGASAGYAAGEWLNGVILSTSVDDLNDRTKNDSISVPYPERKRGQWSCICRVNKDGRSTKNCPDGPDVAYGYGEGPDIMTAKRAAEKQAKDILKAVSTHHPTCRCTSPTGMEVIPTR